MISSTGTTAQDLSKHRWNDRVIIVVVEDASDPTLQKQLEEFERHREGMKERKLVVYQVLPEKYTSDIVKEEQWMASSEMYDIYKSSNSDFSALLIGLDGGVKLRKQDLLSCKELFGVIDQMPMRRAEMNKARQNR